MSQPHNTTEDWTQVGTIADFPPGTATRREVGDVEVAIVNADCGWRAIDDVCSHGEVSLSEGEVDGCFLECWLHGSRFDLRTGEPVSPPATRAVPVYAIRVDGDTPDSPVYVSINQGVPSS